ncbi:MAG: beta-lactamase family protein [Abitibacteriaceae bacterium]|nr:beta-lactamase family protein [Abditibacteriaceae bacterium]
MHNVIYHCLATSMLAALAISAFALATESPAQAADNNVAQGPAAVLQPLVDRHELAGAVALAATKDRVLSLEAVGFEDVAGHKPMRTDALFWIASQSKPMTATALMMLVDEGKVNVDDPVEKYLPEFKGQMLQTEQDENHILLKKPAHPILVHNVLSHTSGLPFSSPLEQPTLDVLPLSYRVRSYAMMPLKFEPDTKYEYSNAGINTAARIIEVVSGMSYEEFMQKRLFDPLGMKDTTFWPNQEQLGRLAKAYQPNAAKNDLQETTISQLHYPLDDHTQRYPMPAGGLFSTATDVGRFCQMILNGGMLDGKRYLSEPAVKQMTTRQTRPGLEGYGFGWSVGDNWFGHGGAYSTNMTIDTQHGLITVFLVQHAGFPGEGGKSYDAFKQAAIKALAVTK